MLGSDPEVESSASGSASLRHQRALHGSLHRTSLLVFLYQPRLLNAFPSARQRQGSFLPSSGLASLAPAPAAVPTASSSPSLFRSSSRFLSLVVDHGSRESEAAVRRPRPPAVLSPRASRLPGRAVVQPAGRASPGVHGSAAAGPGRRIGLSPPFRGRSPVKPEPAATIVVCPSRAADSAAAFVAHAERQHGFFLAHVGLLVLPRRPKRSWTGPRPSSSSSFLIFLLLHVLLPTLLRNAHAQPV